MWVHRRSRLTKGAAGAHGDRSCRTAARVQAALTVVQQHSGKPCTLTVTSRAGAVIALAADSRLMSAT